MLRYVERLGTDCEKWDGLNEEFGTDGLLALWVADMDFQVDEHILEAIQKYLETGVLGYYMPPATYYQSFIDWERDVHGLHVERDWIRFSPGVVTGFHMAVQALTEPGDAVMVSTPVYYPFFHAAEANNRPLVCDPLHNENGIYSIDFDEFERKIVENEVKAYILCSPHNPVCRVWTPDELTRLLEICRAHGVTIISDEIHQDLLFDGHVHTPLLRLANEDDNVLLITAASKTFNIASLRNSFIVIRNPELRERWDAYAAGLRFYEGNPIGYVAVEAAYTYGKPWLEEVKETVWGNYRYMADAFAKALPKVVVTPLEGTYLAWADFKAYLSPDKLIPFMQDTCKLAFDYGTWFRDAEDSAFIRINLATSRENIEEMVRRIVANLA